MKHVDMLLAGSGKPNQAKSFEVAIRFEKSLESQLCFPNKLVHKVRRMQRFFRKIVFFALSSSAANKLIIYMLVI